MTGCVAGETKTMISGDTSVLNRGVTDVRERFAEYRAKYDFKPVCEALSEARRAIVIGHVSPDGDCVGSALGLAHGLRAVGKDAQVVFYDDVPRYLQFLPGAEDVIKPEATGEVFGKPDLVILVDCATLDRTGGDWLRGYLDDTPLVIIDHHAMRDDIPAASLIDPRAAATAELIFLLLLEMGVSINLSMARCLYAALCTDTGGFRFTNTKTQTLRIAAELLDMGIDLEEMRVQLFESRSYQHIRLLGNVLANLQKTDDNKIAWCWVDAELREKIGANTEDAGNISGSTMMLEGVKIGIFLDQRTPDAVKVSFRGRNGYNVGGLAARFGGGGHYAASGCTVPGTVAEVLPVMLAAAKELLIETEAAMAARAEAEAYD